MDVMADDIASSLVEIPNAWKRSSVGEGFDVCDQLRLPLSQAVRERMAGSYPYYGPTGIQGHISEYRVDGEYALIGEDGDHFLKWRDQPMTLLVSGKFNVNNHAHLVRGSKNLTAWFYWYFANKDITSHLTRQGAGRYKLTKRALVTLECLLPPLDEQRAIAGALGDVDALLGALDRLIAKKRDLKQAAMHRLLTGQTRLPGFTSKWETKRIGDLARVDPEQLPSDTKPDYEFKYISLEDVDLASLRSHTTQVFGSSPSRARRRLLRDDVLVSTVRPNLKSHLWFKEVTSDWICSTGFAVLRCQEKISHPGFLFAHLFANGIARQIDTLLTGSNYPAINSRDVRQLELPAPAFDEQAAIAAVLSDMDAELTALEQRRDKTRLLKQGMMQELLTGRTRLV